MVLTFAAIAFASAQGRVISVDQNDVLVSVEGAKAGMSAIILYEYKNDSTISANCATIKADKTTATLKCSLFNLYDQSSAPTLTLPIRKDDKALFTPLGSSAIVIAPDLDRYVKARRADLSYVHSDLFAHQLVTDDVTKPTIADFRRFCDRLLVGAVVFAFSDGDYTVDCQTFALLEVAPYSAAASKKQILPFFHRLGAIDNEIDDFDAYYKRLIKEF
jgi:hypothetical protein